MDRKIVDYHQDEEGDWVAELDCGHFQHVRHNPPWTNRPWVVDAEGRQRMLGAMLQCKKCDLGQPPDRKPSQPGCRAAKSSRRDVMLRTLLLAACATCSLPSFGQTKSDPVRLYADSMAKAIVADDEQLLFDNFAPVLLSSYQRAELLAPLNGIRAMFGKITRYEYRNSTVGRRLIPGHIIRTATCWYAASTTKLTPGVFLKVEVTYAAGRYYLAGYSVDRFIGNRIPPELRGSVPRSGS